MKLLFDQNISFRLVSGIKHVFSNSFQVRELGLENATDMQIWQHAKKNNMTIVTFDADFYDLSLLKGHPPKIIWLRTGNKTTNNLKEILLKNADIVKSFVNDSENSGFGCLEIK